MKLRNPTARSNTEWIGNSPDHYPPWSVVLRIIVRQNALCAITGKPIKSITKDQVTVEHIRPLADGGENRESNIQIVLRGTDKEKTAREVTARAKANRARKKDLGLDEPKGPPLQNRNDLPAKDTSKSQKAHERIERLLPPRRGGLAVQFGIVKK